MTGIGLHHRQIRGIASRQQGQRTDGSSAVILAPTIGVDPLGQTAGGVRHDQCGLGAIVRRRGGVGPHDGQRDGNIRGDSVTPAFETQDATAGLGSTDRPTQGLARVAGEKRHGTRARTRSQNDIIDGQHAGRWRASGDVGHQNLIGRKRRYVIMIHGRRPGMINPPAHPGGSEIPGPGAVERTEIRCPEVGCLRLQRGGQGHQQCQGNRRERGSNGKQVNHLNFYVLDFLKVFFM